MSATSASDRAAATPTLHLARWTVTSGSNVNSRGAVVIASGEHQWEASAEGNGAVDALFRAVDRALAGVLTGHPRLLAYDVHAVAEGPDAEGRVTVTIAPPSAAGGARATGRYTGETTQPQHHRGVDRRLHRGASTCCSPRSTGRARRNPPATASARRVEDEGGRRQRRAELDPTRPSRIDTTEWFKR